MHVSSIHVVHSIQQEAAGPSYAIPRLCQSLCDLGDVASLHCTGAVPAKCKIPVRTYDQWPYPSRLGVSPAMSRALREAAVNSHIMHTHSLWMMPNIYPAWATRGSNCRLVVSPHGTLAPWALSKSRWAKRLIWPLQKETLVRAACLHATAETEYQHIRNIGLRAPVAVISFGIDIPVSRRFSSEDGRRQLLYLGRIDPIKGIDLLLRVWRKVGDVRSEWELRLIGPGSGGYLQHLQELSKTLALQRVSFEGPLYGDDKQKAYQSADLYILPSHTENFGITVAEALANGVPAIVTKGAPWQGLETNDCGWWVNRDERTLCETLQTALSLSRAELREMGERGRSWMQRDFSWGVIGRRMHLTYEWLLGGGPVPDWVRVK